MKYSGIAVQKALYAALNNAVTLSIDAVDFTLPVSVVTTETLFKNGPYIVIGEDSAIPEREAGVRGQARTARVEIWASGSQGRRQTKEAAAQIIAILDNSRGQNESPVTVDGFHLLCCKWVADESPTVDDDGETYITSLSFYFLLSEES